MPIISSVAGNFSPIGRSRKPFNLATGGNIVTDVANYNGTGQLWRVHTFTSNGTFSVLSNLDTFRTLVVAGGGTGAINYWNGAVTGSGAGGGAGGMLENTSLSLNIGNSSVIVGAATQNSSFSGISCTAGGRGGYSFATRSTSGGSGGGGDGDSDQGYNRDGAAGILGQGTYGENGAVQAGGNGGGADTGLSTTHSRSGRSSNISGTSTIYSIGGLKNSASTPSGYGHGGGGATYNATNNQSGSPGVVIVAYRIG